MTNRNVLLHYHIFKNSGTTFERVLNDNYGEQHISFDGPFPFSHINQDQLSMIIERHPTAVACSSHQIHLPIPSSMAFQAIPIVFIRNPMLRIRSVYFFSQRQNKSLGKRAHDNPLEGLEDWVVSALAGDHNLNQISNLQTGFVSRCYNLPPKRQGIDGRVNYDLQTAINNLSLVPCLGRTEHFDTDVASFAGTLARFDIPFSYQPKRAENISSPDHGQPISEQLDAMQEHLTAATWDRLRWMNHQDLALYDIVHDMLEKRLANGFTIPVA